MTRGLREEISPEEREKIVYAAIHRATALKLLPDRATPFAFERPMWCVGSAMFLTPTVGLAGFAGISVAVLILWILSQGLGAIAITRYRSRRVLKILKESHGLLCPRCHYNLSALEPSGQCPECASAYTSEHVRRIWMNSYSLWNTREELRQR